MAVGWIYGSPLLDSRSRILRSQNEN